MLFHAWIQPQLTRDRPPRSLPISLFQKTLPNTVICAVCRLRDRQSLCICMDSMRGLLDFLEPRIQAASATTSLPSKPYPSCYKNCWRAPDRNYPITLAPTTALHACYNDSGYHRKAHWAPSTGLCLSMNHCKLHTNVHVAMSACSIY